VTSHHLLLTYMLAAVYSSICNLTQIIPNNTVFRGWMPFLWHCGIPWHYQNSTSQHEIPRSRKIVGPSNDSVGNITVMMCTSSIRSEWLTGSWLNDRCWSIDTRVDIARFFITSQTILWAKIMGSLYW